MTQFSQNANYNFQRKMISLKGSERPDEVEEGSSEDEVEEEEVQGREESSSDDDSASDVPEDEMESGDDEEEEGEEKSGWADAMAKVLGMGKTAEPNKPLLLSKAKKDGEKAAADTDQGTCFDHFLNYYGT